MRVLVVHNRYVSSVPSGENTVVDRQLELLAEDRELQVESLIVSSDSVNDLSLRARAQLPLAPIVGAKEPLALFNERLSTFLPDVVHLHNPFPFFSPRLASMSQRSGVAMVQTIHNYRHRCMNGLLFRDGQVCTDCEDGRLRHVPGVVRGCYRGSRVQSIPMAIALTRHRSVVQQLDRVVAVSQFVADRVISWGVPSKRVHVIPNPVAGSESLSPDGAAGLLFAGRLSSEKGLLQLIQAWETAALPLPHRLLIAGSGPLESEIKRRVAADPSIELLGFLNPEELRSARARTRAAVSCSRAFETATSAAESFAVGRPVLAIDVGAQGQVVPDSAGWVVAPDQESFAAGVRRACLEPIDTYAERCIAAHEVHAARFSNAAHLSELKSAYRIAVHQERST